MLLWAHLSWSTTVPCSVLLFWNLARMHPPMNKIQSSKDEKIFELLIVASYTMMAARVVPYQTIAPEVLLMPRQQRTYGAIGQDVWSSLAYGESCSTFGCSRCIRGMPRREYAGPNKKEEPASKTSHFVNSSKYQGTFQNSLFQHCTPAQDLSLRIKKAEGTDVSTYLSII